MFIVSVHKTKFPLVFLLDSSALWQRIWCVIAEQMNKKVVFSSTHTRKTLQEGEVSSQKMAFFAHDGEPSQTMLSQLQIYSNAKKP